jgi:hypothetical protein
MLARFWGLRNDDEATEVVTCMSEFGIDFELRRKGDNAVCITLHDLTHDVCVARASREGGVPV